MGPLGFDGAGLAVFGKVRQQTKHTLTTTQTATLHGAGSELVAGVQKNTLTQQWLINVLQTRES